MTDPLDTNDDWADLAREFNLDKPAAPPDMVERHVAEEAIEPHHGTDARAEETAVSEGETEAEATEEEFDDAESPQAEEAGTEGDGGTGRKRRRRRRRRRKGAADGAAPVAETEADEAPEAEAEADEEAGAEPVVEAAGYTEDESEDEGAETDIAPLAAEEDTASEVLRELIATWNVPSWGEIVDGLYRPH